MSYYSYEKLNPRPGPEAEEYNASLLGGNAFGVEVSLSHLAALCGLGNIDPQHLGGDSTVAAIEACITAQLPPQGAMLVTVRPDLDSVGGMAVLTIRAHGIELSFDSLQRINMIAVADKFDRGGWPGVQPLPNRERWGMVGVTSASANDMDLPLGAIGAATADPTLSVEQRVQFMIDWILKGCEPAGYRARFNAERETVLQALERGEIKTETIADGNIAIVISKFRLNTSLGYCLAPVVIAHNPVMKFDGGQPHPHFFVCQFTEEWIDLKEVERECNAIEHGWGGSKTIIGSPQGHGTVMSLDQVSEIVKRNLKT